MSTKTVTTLTPEERQQLSVDLLTQTPVTKQNYYSLYVTNPQVNCICKIWNRIVYCLFSWLGWFLGEASDVNRKVSMNQETALIQNYNQAKKTLLEALNKEKAESYPEAEANYLTALNARVEQIHTFGYSTQAIQRGCKFENDDLLKVATAELQKALKEGILLPASLRSMSQQDVQPNTQSTSLQTDPTPPPQEDRVKKEALDARKQICDILAERPRPSAVAKAVAIHYRDVFKTYQAAARTNPDDFTLFYTELEAISSSLKDSHLELMYRFVELFNLHADPQFLETYPALASNWLITKELHFVNTLGSGKRKGAYACLIMYAVGMREIYNLVRSSKKESSKKDSDALPADPDPYVKRKLSALLSQLSDKEGENYASYAKNYSAKSRTHMEEQTFDLANHLAFFSKDPQPSKAEEFIDKVLGLKPKNAEATL